jgi:hypothetical protein
MKSNLESLLSEIQDHLESRGIAVFHGTPRGGEDIGVVYWDTKHHSDFHDYVAAAQAAGVHMVTMYANQFSEEVIDDAQERLDQASLSREERRSIEQRLREMRAYAGFTCQIELSFDVAPRVYVFDLRTDWYEDFNDLVYQIDDAYEEHDDEEPLGGYFSKN